MSLSQSSTVQIHQNNYNIERRKKPLKSSIETALNIYFSDLDGHCPSDLYEMVLCEVEPPLLKSVLNYTKGNQSKAAEILGLNRSTLRKKLVKYGLNT
ncbi:MAG: DNA-binding transcriptional regulator Fis [Gammaproteobacteria bacterium]